QYGQVRYVIAESKWGSSKLGEFEIDLLDDQGNATGKKGRYLQGSREWIENVLHRMRTRGSPHDVQIAAEVAEALQQKQLDFLLFKVNGQKPSQGSFEIGPVEPGVTTPREG